jgi:hypothetical protein
MSIQPNILTIKQAFEELTDEVEDQWIFSEEENETRAISLVETVTDLFHHLAKHDQPEAKQSRRRSDQSSLPDNLSELTNQCINNLAELAQLGDIMESRCQSAEIRELIFPLALWLSDLSGQIHQMSIVVDVVAKLANKQHNTETLTTMYHQVSQIINAIPNTQIENRTDEEAQATWRLLIINHSIIATRTHDSSIIEAAYQNLVERIPEEAPYFFSQAMEQMRLIDYPKSVCNIVEKYYLQWSDQSTLH